MRLLYVIDSLRRAGAEQSLASMAPMLRDLGVELHVAALRERDGVQAELIDAGAVLHPVAGGGGRAGDLGRVRRLVVDVRPDVVHTTLYEADIVGRVASRLARVPVSTSLVGVPGTRPPGVSRARLAAALAIDRATIRLAGGVHAISSTIAAAAGSRLGLAADRIDVIPRGRDPRVLGARTVARRAAARDLLGVGPEEAVVLVAARHDWVKGVDVLVAAFPAVRRELGAARLVLAGGPGSASPEVARLVRELELTGSVDLLGERDDVADLLTAADVLAVPSRSEGMGSVLLEAMALETPIVASDLPAIGEVVDDATAVLVPPDDPGELANAIVRAVRSPGDRAERARHRFLEAFTLERTVPAMIAFWERVAGGAT